MVYKFLIDPTSIKTNSVFKRNILFCLINLYFRTPKFLNIENRKSDNYFDNLAINNNDAEGVVSFEHFGQKGYFHITQIDKLKSKQREINKLDFLQNNFEGLKKFIDENNNARIVIYKITDDVCLISSDNPVIINSSSNMGNNIFDKNNIISIPLDHKHFLKIFLNEGSKENLEIFREDKDKWFAFTLNQSIEDNCENCIYGKEGTITQHIKNKEDFNNGFEEKMKLYELEVEIVKPVSEFIVKKGYLTDITLQFINNLILIPKYKSNEWLLKLRADIDKKRANINDV